MFTYWNVSEDEDSGYYGENGNPANSLHFEITDGTNGLGPTYGYVIRYNGEIVNSVPSTMFDDYFTAKDAMNEALPIDLLNSTAPDYDPSIYEKLGERKLSAVFWNKAPCGNAVNGYKDNAPRYTTASVKTSNPFDYWYSNNGEYFYGIKGDESKSVELDIVYGDEEDGIEPHAEIVAPNGGTCAERSFGFGATEDEIKRWFEDYCYSDIYMPDYVDTTGIETASKKTASTYEFLDDYTYGDPYDEQNSVTLDIDSGYGGYEATIYAPEYVPGITPEPLEGGAFETEEEAFKWFRKTCESSERIKQKLNDNYEPPMSSFIASSDEDSLSDDLDDISNDNLASDYEAKVGAKQWIEENMSQYINASRKNYLNTNRTLRTSSVRTSYRKWGLQNNGTYCSYNFGVPDSFDPSDNLECTIMDNGNGYDDYVGEVYFQGEVLYTTDSGSEDDVEVQIEDFLDDNADDILHNAKTASVKTSDEDSLSDDLEDMNDDYSLYEDDAEVPDAIASRRDIRKSDRELVFWDRDVQLEMAFEHYGIENDETHSLAISVAPAVDGYGMEGADLGFDAVIQYPAYGFYGTADTVSADTVEEALELAEDFCLNHAMEYLNFSDVTSSVKKSSPGLIPWGLDIQPDSAVEYYGIDNDEAHSIAIMVSPNVDEYDMYGGGTGFSALVYTVSHGIADKFNADTIEDALKLAEDFCRDHAMEYLNLSDVIFSKRTSGRTFKTAKRKWNARERLALINEEKLIDDEFDDLI